MKIAIIRGVTVGTDFECFVANQSNEIVSAEGHIPGTKWEPHYFSNDGFSSVQLDNVLAEGTIVPAKTEDEFLEGIKKTMGFMDSLIAPKNLHLVTFPAFCLNQKYLETENAQTFGCDPDFDAWLQDINSKPKADDPTLRSAGGHIHIGYENPDQDTNEAIIKAMDLFVGIPSVIMEPENKRKELYGKAGAFRPKGYGVEYRTVSNFYLHSEGLIRWAFRNTMSAVDFLNKKGVDELNSLQGEIVQAINTNNKDLAWNLVRHFDLEVL